MIQFNPVQNTYVPTAQPQMAGLYQDVAKQNFIPEPQAGASATPTRPVADEYDKNQNTTAVVTDSRPAPEPQRAHKTDTSDAGNSTRQDNGSTDDSRGDARRDAERRQQELNDQAVLRELRGRDAQVRAHEAAHAAVGGQYAGTPSFQYRRGPDGQSYAVGGEVPIDVSPVAGNPTATIAKLQTVARAALAPADPSPADRRIASRAQAGVAEARAELLLQQRREAAETETFRREGKTDDVDASRITFTNEPKTYIPNPFGARPSNNAQPYIGGDSAIGIRLASPPVNIMSRLRQLGVTETPSRDFRATA